MKMDSVDRFAVLASIGDECIKEVEIQVLLKGKATPVCYVWFEPSSEMTIAEGIMKTMYVNKMVKAGCTVKVLMADLFARNKKIAYNLDRARAIGCYNIELWKALGMDLGKVGFMWLSDELNHHPADYWLLALDVSRKNDVDQLSRCRKNMDMEPHELEIFPVAEIFYPCIQVAALLSQKVDMWLLSIDDRDVGKLAKLYAKRANRENNLTILFHNMLPGLIGYPELHDKGGLAQNILMEDEVDTLSFKMRRVFCPLNVASVNPCLEYIRYVILPWFGTFEVVLKEGDGGSKTFSSMEELIFSYENGVIDSANVKLAFGRALNKILQPVHDHFSSNNEARALIITAERASSQSSVKQSPQISWL
ncbi:hypothetical protein SORBI_3004G240600 [Sorghum bicolor]|uniref:Uncharacterized protein n=1 Tax=Sorghum bicolor TaxID=4558 RepID=A0A194YSK8_SORBI|nr:hypothetical protein SORBI_3004G240600 [Sorghum bicolor]